MMPTRTWPRMPRKKSTDSSHSTSSDDGFHSPLHLHHPHNPVPGSTGTVHLHTPQHAEHPVSSNSISHAVHAAPAHGGAVGASTDALIPHAPVFLDDHSPVEYFRQDVIRLIHQSRIPGWSQVTSDMAFDLDMTRINGASTNSVYSVRPPSYVKDAVKREHAGRPYHHKSPPASSSRVYGPNVGMSIDRKKESKTVAELTRHNIGPRLSGTFQNGRFEQFLNAKPSTREDSRQPEVSVQIAKRMCDSHKNVPLSPQDIKDGAVVWQYVRKWMPAAREQSRKLEAREPGTIQRVSHRPKFEDFESALAKYEQYLGDKHPIVQTQPPGSNSLVFCHNDTQYGNMSRLEPPKGSPSSRPQNEHRQLVVIDFEYSGANPRAVDIANHFCEWMNDYHHPTMPHHIWLDRYPTHAEQERFITSYVEHGATYFDEEVMDSEVKELIAAVADFRAAVSAFWGSWGIVQTPIETDQQSREEMLDQNPHYELTASPGENIENIEPEEDDMFDYSSYSSEKLASFWSDYENHDSK